jgi:hypothetical protein
MVQAVVDEALGPTLAWTSKETEPAKRVSDLIGHAFPRMLKYEATHRAALSLALDQWIRRQAGTLGGEARIVRGNRRGLLKDALKPLDGKVSTQVFDKLARSLSLIFGIEAIIVLKDIWHLDDEKVRETALWAARALVAAAVAESSHGRSVATAPRTKKNAAKTAQGKA